MHSVVTAESSSSMSKSPEGISMRLLHTSDWHLGHTFCDQSRAREQAAFLDWLVDTVDQKQVDALVVAGDIFDNPASPNEAFELYYRFLARLATLEGPTRSGGRRTAVVVGGNHDSPGRLDAPREVLHSLSINVIGGYDAGRTSDLANPTGQLVPLRSADGHVGVVVAAVPFLNDWRIGVRGFDADAEAQRASMHDSFRGVYASLADKANAMFPGVPLVATGHLTCLPTRGQKVSDEDAVPAEINRVGTLGAMAPDIFDPRFAYIALGHIHRGFSVDAEARIRYSGTPVQVGVTESAARRVLLVDIDSSGTVVESLTVPVTRQLIAVRGDVDEVTTRLASLTVPSGELDPYVAVRVTLTTPTPRIADILREAAGRNPHCRPAIVDVQAPLERTGASPALPAEADTRQLTLDEAFLFAWRTKNGANSDPPESVLQRFQSLLDNSGRQA
jgi:exonuclease SbcD